MSAKDILCFFLVLILIWVTIITMFWLTDKMLSDAYAGSQPVAITIEPGDTLWSIAKRYYPDKHTGQMVEVIRQLNPDLDTGRLQVGQVVWLPGEVMQ